jgi:hypothetical protein
VGLVFFLTSKGGGPRTYPTPRMSLFSRGIGQPLILPEIGVKVGHSPLGQLTEVMTVSRPMG